MIYCVTLETLILAPHVAMNHLPPLWQDKNVFMMCLYFAILGFSKIIEVSLICFRPPASLSRLHYKYYSVDTETIEFDNICLCGRKEKRALLQELWQEVRINEQNSPSSPSNLWEIVGSVSWWSFTDQNNYSTHDSKVEQMANKTKVRCMKHLFRSITENYFRIYFVTRL